MRHLVLAMGLAALGLSFAAPLIPNISEAQVKPNDQATQEQFVPESFKITGQAIAQPLSSRTWTTVINYQLQNNSGMNLYLGIEGGNVSYGACTQVDGMRGGLPSLPSPGASSYSSAQGAGPPRGIYIPAGAKVGGSIIMTPCGEPNPGFPTAPLGVSLMIGKKADFDKMFTYPISADIPIRQITE